MKKCRERRSSRLAASPPFESGLIPNPLIALRSVNPPPRFILSKIVPLLSCNTPSGFDRKVTMLSDNGLIGGGADVGKEKGKGDGKSHPSQKNLNPVQRQNHFHISQETTDSEGKERDGFQHCRRLKQTRHCAFPMWTGAQPRPITCCTASMVSPPLAPALCETELGHLSSVSLPHTLAPSEIK